MTLKHLSSLISISINGPTDYAKNATSKWIKGPVIKYLLQGAEDI